MILCLAPNQTFLFDLVATCVRLDLVHLCKCTSKGVWFAEMYVYMQGC